MVVWLWFLKSLPGWHVQHCWPMPDPRARPPCAERVVSVEDVCYFQIGHIEQVFIIQEPTTLYCSTQEIVISKFFFSGSMGSECPSPNKPYPRSQKGTAEWEAGWRPTCASEGRGLVGSQRGNQSSNLACVNAVFHSFKHSGNAELNNSKKIFSNFPFPFILHAPNPTCLLTGPLSLHPFIHPFSNTFFSSFYVQALC